jgi:hypothetical protein
MTSTAPKSHSNPRRIYDLPATSFVSDILHHKCIVSPTKQGFEAGGWRVLTWRQFFRADHSSARIRSTPENVISAKAVTSFPRPE